MLVQLLGFTGRIGRGTWWIVQIALFVAGLLSSFILPPPPAVEVSQSGQIAQTAKATLDSLLEYYLSSIPLLFLAFLQNALFITSSVQRIQDRNGRGWRVIFAYVPLAMVFVGLFQIAAESLLIGSGLLFAGLFGLLVATVWIVIECGMLSGDDSENDYGFPANSGGSSASLDREIQNMRGQAAAMDNSSSGPNPALPTAFSQVPMSYVDSSPRPVFGKR
jgi:uncharacterized membrane protein YhaH (DUF805 family)